MTANAWTAVIAGVDTSAEAAGAAEVAWMFAQEAGVPCRLVHAVRDQAAEIAPLQLPMDVVPMQRMLGEVASGELVETLRGRVAPPLLEMIEVRVGRPARVLGEVARRTRADLIVIGDKRRTAVERWLRRSTVHDLLRSSPVPVLIAGPRAGGIRRVLVAVDFSDALQPALAAAERCAALFGAALRILHVVEPVPPALRSAVVNDDAVFQRSRELLEQTVRPLVRYQAAHELQRRGPVAQTIRDEAVSWRADMVVVGSHGKGAVDRVLVGSTTLGLAGDLPTALLVVPPTRRAARAARPATRTPRAVAGPGQAK
jgi:nucleotide-binding universal stress UspA family protein